MNKHRTTIIGLLRIALSLLLLALLIAFAAMDVAEWRRDRRGIENGLSRELAPIAQPRYGTNVALEQYDSDQALRQALQVAQSMGVGVLRQHLPWAEIEPERGAFAWEPWDRIVAAAAEIGIQLILVLDTSPTWARREWDADNVHAPAARHEDYAAFVQAAAERYQGRVLAYQIWDNPNVAPNWGAGEISPVSYVEMLRQASAAIRAADPAALILAGGMSPTTETRGRNMSDVLFVRELVRLDATALFDGLAVKSFGFWSGAYDRRTAEDVLNWSRLVLIREELRRLGAEELPIWAVEGGWAALPADWAGAPSPVGSDSAAVQAQRLQDGLARARAEWPWLGLLCVQHLQPAAEAHDPAWGLSLLAPDGTPTALGQALGEAVNDGGLLYSGNYEAQRLVAGRGSDGYLDLTIYGTELAVAASPGAQASTVRVADTLSGVWRTVALDPRSPSILLVRSQAATWIGVRIEGSPTQFAALRSFRVGYVRRWHRAWWSMLAALAGSSCLLALAWRDLATVPWRGLWSRLVGLSGRLPRWVPALIMGVLAAVALWGPTSGLRLLGVLGYAALAMLYPELGLRAALIALFLAPLKVRLGGWQFSCTELAILFAVASLAWDLIARGVVRATLADWWRRRSLSDLVVALYVALGLAAALRAVYQREALRELRLVFIEPALLYVLLRLHLHQGPQAQRIARLLLWAGVGLAAYALAAYALPSGAIEAEGIRRARAFFGSPNNLALLLERIAPLGLALGLAASSWRQRWLFFGATGLLLVVVALTFSRGAWVLGIPAGMLLVLALHSRRGRWAVVILVLCGVLLLVPLSRMPRLADLADLSSGTSFLRVQLWRSSWHMVREHLWGGVGPDNFLYYYGDYILPGAEVDRWLSHPHNIILDFWLRLGLPGLALLALFAYTTVRLASRSLKGATPQRACALGLLGGMAAMLAHGLVDSALFVTELACWFLAALALFQSLSPCHVAPAPDPCSSKCASSRESAPVSD